jgi:hypothetical protein
MIKWPSGTGHALLRRSRKQKAGRAQSEQAASQPTSQNFDHLI